MNGVVRCVLYLDFVCWISGDFVGLPKCEICVFWYLRVFSAKFCFLLRWFFFVWHLWVCFCIVCKSDYRSFRFFFLILFLLFFILPGSESVIGFILWAEIVCMILRYAFWIWWVRVSISVSVLLVRCGLILFQWSVFVCFLFILYMCSESSIGKWFESRSSIIR